MTLVEFLIARLEEDEAYADSGYCQCMACMRLRDEAEAKRRIIQSLDVTNDGSIPAEAWVVGKEILRAMAAVYADHEDYRTEWDPQPNG